jgi:hypothetical protein
VTAESDFTQEEWRTVLEAPPSAGMIVLTAQSGGSFKEMWAMSKAYSEARKQHGESELLDAVVSANPKVDHTHYRSPGELREGGLRNLTEAVNVLAGKADAEEIDGYKRFIVTLSHEVAAAHREGGQDVSPAEQEAIQAIAQTLGVAAA